MFQILAETFRVVGLGVLAALAANYFSPRGLSLARDYFPVKSTSGAGANIAAPPAGTLKNKSEPAAVAASEPAAPRQNSEIATLTTAQALELFRDPEYEQESIVFVDARNTRHYEAGHIPGAYELDRYYPENHLPTVLPVCLNASRIVVYCTGGECEDSHFAAQLLREAGVPAGSLTVYTGGITEWEATRLPVETGPRRSGEMKAARP